MSNREEKKRFIDYILPFLIFISLGIIIVLSVQLWRTLNPQNLSSEAYLYLDQGKAQILPWGINEWEPGFNGSKILQGDIIKLSSKGRAVLNLFDGSIIRLGPNSELKVNELSQEKNNFSAQFVLINGSAWTNVSSNSQNSEIQIRTDHINTISKGTIFSVETENNEIVRLFEGSLELEIFTSIEDQEQVAEKIQLSANKQITLTAANIKAYQDHQSPKVITEIPESFKETNWYQWNTKEDKNPTKFDSKPQSNLSNSEQPATPETSFGTQESEPASEETTEEQETEIEDKFATPPTITTPAQSQITTNENEITIKGTAPSNTEKIVVISTENGVEDEYTLQNFKPGSSTWQYKAATKFGNLQEGKNEFKVYAIDKNNAKSTTTKVTIIYQPKEQEATPDN